IPNAEHVYIDLAGPDNVFATIDLDEDPPLLFIGREVTLAELGLAKAESTERPREVKGLQLKCPQCGASLPLRAPDRTQRAVCAYCNSLVSVEHGNLKWLEALQQD